MSDEKDIVRIAMDRRQWQAFASGVSAAQHAIANADDDVALSWARDIAADGFGPKEYLTASSHLARLLYEAGAITGSEESKQRAIAFEAEVEASK